jgi:hypothetical protein
MVSAPTTKVLTFVNVQQDSREMALAAKVRILLIFYLAIGERRLSKMYFWKETARPFKLSPRWMMFYSQIFSMGKQACQARFIIV